MAQSEPFFFVFFLNVLGIASKLFNIKHDILRDI